MSLAGMTHQSQKLLETSVFGSSVAQSSWKHISWKQVIFPFAASCPLQNDTSTPKKTLATSVFGSSVTQRDLELMKTHLLEASDHPLCGHVSCKRLNPLKTPLKPVCLAVVWLSLELIETNLLEASDHPLCSFMSLESVTS